MKKTDKMMGGENEVLRLMVREKKATDFQYDALMVNFEKIFAKETESVGIEDEWKCRIDEKSCNGKKAVPIPQYRLLYR